MGWGVEPPIGGLHQPSNRRETVRAVSLRAKAVKRGQRAGGGDFENGGSIIPLYDVLGASRRRAAQAKIGPFGYPEVTYITERHGMTE